MQDIAGRGDWRPIKGSVIAYDDVIDAKILKKNFLSREAFLNKCPPDARSPELVDRFHAYVVRIHRKLTA